MPFLFISLSFASDVIRINVVDSFFCADSISSTKLIKVNKEALLSKEASSQCDKADFNSPRYHGRQVVESFIKEYKGKKKIEINPIVVFNDRGEHDLAAWIKAFSFEEQQKSDFILMAIGIPFLSKEDYLKSGVAEKIKFLKPTYVAKKQIGRHVSASHFVFPSDTETHNINVISKDDFPDRLRGHILHGNSLSVVLGLVNKLK